MDRANIWSTQHLVEFVAAVGAFPDEVAAESGALELAAEALEAEIGLIVRRGEVSSSIGIPAGRRPPASLLAAVDARASTVDLPALGRCQMLHVPLHDAPGTLVLGRQGGDAFTQEEVSLAGGMARILALSLRTLRLLEAERALRAQSERQAREALHDSLTGLPNRGLFLDRLAEIIEGGGRRGRLTALLFLDMDGFKIVNDSLGHQAGDRLLVAVAERLVGCIADLATAYRLGGDEFAVLVEVDDSSDAVALADCILHAVAQPFTLCGRQVFVTASIGIALSEASTIEASELLRGADVAMYRAKAEGRNGLVVFEPTMHDIVFRRLQLEADLREAIAGDGLRLLLQPIVELGSGEVSGVEALVRWEHPTLGSISPLDFIGLAEESGLIVPLGRWVLGEACRQLADLGARHPAAASMTISVNVSARQFKQHDLVADVVAALDASDLRPDQLVLEITETVLLESTSQTTANIAELHRLGVALAIDDFGTGYSSLGYLQRFPIKILKIDKSFIDGMLDDDVALVRAVVNLGHSLGLSVTAEGCETIAQMEILRALGCDRSQGHLFARPLTRDALFVFLDDALARARAGWTPVSA